jgi:hypothetical protein
MQCGNYAQVKDGVVGLECMQVARQMRRAEWSAILSPASQVKGFTGPWRCTNHLLALPRACGVARRKAHTEAGHDEACQGPSRRGRYVVSEAWNRAVTTAALALKLGSVLSRHVQYCIAFTPTISCRVYPSHLPRRVLRPVSSTSAPHHRLVRHYNQRSYPDCCSAY